jgi:hypothetical protein
MHLSNRALIRPLEQVGSSGRTRTKTASRRFGAPALPTVTVTTVARRFGVRCRTPHISVVIRDAERRTSSRISYRIGTGREHADDRVGLAKATPSARKRQAPAAQSVPAQEAQVQPGERPKSPWLESTRRSVPPPAGKSPRTGSGRPAPRNAQLKQGRVPTAPRQPTVARRMPGVPSAESIEAGQRRALPL